MKMDCRVAKATRSFGRYEIASEARRSIYYRLEMDRHTPYGVRGFGRCEIANEVTQSIYCLRISPLDCHVHKCTRKFGFGFGS